MQCQAALIIAQWYRAKKKEVFQAKTHRHVKGKKKEDVDKDLAFKEQANVFMSKINQTGSRRIPGVATPNQQLSKHLAYTWWKDETQVLQEVI